MHTYGFLLAALCAPLLIAAPSAEEILASSRAAIGDVRSVHSLSLKGTRYVITDSQDGALRMMRTVEIDYLLPDKFLRAEAMELPDGAVGPTIVDGLSGHTSWRDVRNLPQEGNVVVRAMPPPGVTGDGPAADLARTRLARHSLLRNILLYTLTPPQGMEVHFEIAGEGETQSGKAWILGVTGPEDFKASLFIDQKSNLPVMISWRGLQGARPMIRSSFSHGDNAPEPAADLPPPPKPQEVEFQLRLFDHATFGPLQMPRRMALTAAGKPVDEFELKSAIINPELSADKFKK